MPSDPQKFGIPLSPVQRYQNRWPEVSLGKDRGNRSCVYQPWRWRAVPLEMQTQPPLQLMGSERENWIKSQHWSNYQYLIGAPVLSLLRLLLTIALLTE